MTDNKKSSKPRAPSKRGKAQPCSADAAQRAAGESATKPRANAPQQVRSQSAEAAPTRESGTSRVLATIPLHVRWRDLDAFNHANNSSYLTYLEEARLQWLRTVPGEWFNAHAMPVMAAVELHYRKPIEWPADIDVLLSCERLGHSSMTIGNRIVARQDSGCVYADGNIVMVWVDPASGASVALPEAIRAACAV